MPLQLYADECVDRRIVTGLRRHGIDVVTAADQNLRGASDEQHLQRALNLDRVLVTRDTDFLAIAAERRRTQKPFPGVLFLSSSMSIGEAVRKLAFASEVLEPAEMKDVVEWL